MRKILLIVALSILPSLALGARLAYVVALPRANLKTVLKTFHGGVSVAKNAAGFYRVSLPIGGDPCNPTGKTLFFRQVINSLQHPTQPSGAPSGRWRLWLVVNMDAADESFVRSSFRWLGRRRKSDPDQVVGPWTIPEFVAFIGARTADDTEDLTNDGVDNPTPVVIRSRFRSGAKSIVPWVIAGDSPERLGAMSYDPTETEIANDTDITP